MGLRYPSAFVLGNFFSEILVINVTGTTLPGVVIIETQVFDDARGFFTESFNARDFADAGLPTHFVGQIIRALRGRFKRSSLPQHPSWQGKLVRALVGETFDVAVDIRRDSACFGQWFGITLSAQNKSSYTCLPVLRTGFAY